LCINSTLPGVHFMKKKLLIIFSIIVLIIGGYFILNEFKKKQLVNEAQEKAEEYVLSNFEEVESVQITPDSYRFKPMGTLGVGGRINEEDKLYFDETFLIEDNEGGEQRKSVKAHYFQERKDKEKEAEET